MPHDHRRHCTADPHEDGGVKSDCRPTMTSFLLLLARPSGRAGGTAYAYISNVHRPYGRGHRALQQLLEHAICC